MYLWSFGFTLLGAGLFSFLWDRNHTVLQEAFIDLLEGIVGARTRHRDTDRPPRDLNASAIACIRQWKRRYRRLHRDQIRANLLFFDRHLTDHTRMVLERIWASTRHNVAAVLNGELTE